MKKTTTTEKIFSLIKILAHHTKGEEETTVAKIKTITIDKQEWLFNQLKEHKDIIRKNPGFLYLYVINIDAIPINTDIQNEIIKFFFAVLKKGKSLKKLNDKEINQTLLNLLPLQQSNLNLLNPAVGKFLRNLDKKYFKSPSAFSLRFSDAFKGIETEESIAEILTNPNIIYIPRYIELSHSVFKQLKNDTIFKNARAYIKFHFHHAEDPTTWSIQLNRRNKLTTFLSEHSFPAKETEEFLIKHSADSYAFFAHCHLILSGLDLFDLGNLISLEDDALRKLLKNLTMITNIIPIKKLHDHLKELVRNNRGDKKLLEKISLFFEGKPYHYPRYDYNLKESLQAFLKWNSKKDYWIWYEKKSSNIYYRFPQLQDFISYTMPHNLPSHKFLFKDTFPLLLKLNTTAKCPSELCYAALFGPKPPSQAFFSNECDISRVALATHYISTKFEQLTNKKDIKETLQECAKQTDSQYFSAKVIFNDNENPNDEEKDLDPNLFS